MKHSKHWLILVTALLLIAGAAFGQGTTSALNGTVTFEGDPLPGATVTISSPNMQGTRTTVTDINGGYIFPSIPPGQYTVTFEMEGMATINKTVRVGLAKTERVNTTMQISSVSDVITVTASAPAVLETTEVQSNFTEETVDNLPVGRTVQNIVTLAPGVNTNGPGGNIVISGAYSYDTLYLVNGAVTNENIRGQTQSLFIEDAVQETSILSGSVSAEYGRFTGGVVSAITKSGGNDFSGSLRDSFSNPAWTSTSPAGEGTPESSLNQIYEGTLGGRIIRDRLWFFGAGRYYKQNVVGYYTNSTIPLPQETDTDKRYEIKLTGQITPSQNLVASYLDYTVEQTPQCAFGCWDTTTIDLNGRTLPSEMKTAHYNGIFSSNFLLEAGYSSRELKFVGSGGEHLTTDFTSAHDIALGTWGYDFTYGGAWGAPIFCGVCEAESRSNDYYNVKGTYYLATQATGSHNIVAGYENFAESRFSNNYQSGSNFDLYIYSGIAPYRDANGNLSPVVSAGDLINYVPIPILSKGSDFVTKSLFVNDKWDLNPNWSFNVGFRYDKNDAQDSAGNKISSDSNTSPRLGVIYDVAGDGRFRVNASYSKYVSRIQEAVGGSGGGGNPWYVFYEYQGPTVGGEGSGLDSFGVLEKVFDWYLAQGGTQASDLIVGAVLPGFNTRFNGDMKSPSVDEWTIGLGTQVGRNGFVRADYIDRSWNDFYAQYTSPNDQVESPIVPGEYIDVLTYGNTNNLERTYHAVELQGGYRLTPKLNLGGNYTWSQAKGNTEGESRGLGPTADAIEAYSEYKSFAQANPVGYLLSDQTHKARIWLTYDQSLGRLGDMNISLLERYDSGTPYSAIANVVVGDYVTDPGYTAAPSRVPYYFSDRGAYRWDNTTATDLALNWNFGLSAAELFFQGEIFNLFDESAQINGSTSVQYLDAFNPFTETPVEGVNWAKSSSFGHARGPADYQAPRFYRFSVGLRF